MYRILVITIVVITLHLDEAKAHFLDATFLQIESSHKRFLSNHSEEFNHKNSTEADNTTSSTSSNQTGSNNTSRGIIDTEGSTNVKPDELDTPRGMGPMKLSGDYCRSDMDCESYCCE